MRHFFAAVAFVCAVGTASAGTIVFQDNFSGAGAPGPLSDATTVGPLFPGANFSLTNGSVDLVGGAFYASLCQNPAAPYCIDTTGSGNQFGTLTSSSISLPTGEYLLTFDLYGWNYLGLTETGQVNVALGTLVNQTYNTDGSVAYGGPNSIVFNVTSSTSAQLVFTDTGLNHSSSFAGSILDNIQLQSIPEPSSLLLAGAGMIAGLAVLRLRKA